MGSFIVVTKAFRWLLMFALTYLCSITNRELLDHVASFTGKV